MTHPITIFFFVLFGLSFVLAIVSAFHGFHDGAILFGFGASILSAFSFWLDDILVWHPREKPKSDQRRDDVYLAVIKRRR